MKKCLFSCENNNTYCKKIIYVIFLKKISDCWELKLGHNAVYYVPPHVRGEIRPKSFYFGETTDLNWCKEQCSKERQCYAYALIGPSYASLENQCYGRGFGTGEVMVQQNGVNSGLKIC